MTGASGYMFLSLITCGSCCSRLVDFASLLTDRIHLADFNAPTATGSLANPWRDRLSTLVPGDPAVRDRDLKLLAWLEYTEMLRDSESPKPHCDHAFFRRQELTDIVSQAQTALRTPAAAAVADIEDEAMSVSDRGGDRPERMDRPTARTASGHSAEDAPSERRKIMEIWRKYGPKWESWSSAWAARNDPSVPSLVLLQVN
jgi:hypothetical protein